MTRKKEEQQHSDPNEGRLQNRNQRQEAMMIWKTWSRSPNLLFQMRSQKIRAFQRSQEKLQSRSSMTTWNWNQRRRDQSQYPAEAEQNQPATLTNFWPSDRRRSRTKPRTKQLRRASRDTIIGVILLPRYPIPDLLNNHSLIRTFPDVLQTCFISMLYPIPTTCLYSLIIKLAIPIPVPIHFDSTPTLSPLLPISLNKVANILPLVAPNGCPNAIAPPFGFTFSI
jgi:hypothetical protein